MFSFSFCGVTILDNYLHKEGKRWREGGELGGGSLCLKDFVNYFVAKIWLKIEDSFVFRIS